jgi:hypothetical protein
MANPAVLGSSASEAAAAAHPDWIAPRRDGDVLLWPAGPKLLADAVENHRSLQSANHVLIQNAPLSELRRRQRETLKISADTLVIASGHQTELYHPGVWAKDALACAAAEKLGGQAWHLRWPGGEIAVTDDPRLTTAAWSGLLRGPSAAHLDRIEAELTKARMLPGTLMPMALAAMRERTEAGESLSALLARAFDRVDESLGMKHRTALVSPMLTGLPYLALVHHLLARSEEFAAVHNRALADYRRPNGLRSPTRPMPDLYVTGERCEVPFWLDRLAPLGTVPLSPSPCTQGEGRGEGSSDAPSHSPQSKGDPHPNSLPEYVEREPSRTRAMVERRAGRWAILAGDDAFVFDPSLDAWSAAAGLGEFLSRHQSRLTPRALTLTLFFRLQLVDQFIHGIGGARYDQVTDSIIRAFFGFEPPRFCVTTATLLLPAAAGREPVDLAKMSQQGHRLKHQLLGDEKPALVAAIAAAPRRSTERALLFRQLHNRLSASASGHPLLLEWQSRFEQAKSQAAREDILFNRELFFALQTPQRLHSLTARQRELLASQP